MLEVPLRRPRIDTVPRELDDNELDELSCAVADACVMWLQARGIELTDPILRQIGATLIGLGARSVEETNGDATVVLAIAADKVRETRN